MNIIKLQVQNIKNIKAVEITPDEGVVKLTGKNGAGKSAILDAIYSGLSGAKLEDIVRHGAEQGMVEIDLGEYVVRRVFSDGKDRVEIRNKEGAKFPAPQTKINEFIGKLTFDPLAFLSMEPSKQRAQLMQMVNLDFGDLEQRYDALYEKRTEINREIKRLEALVGTWKDDAAVPTAELSISEQLAKVQQLRLQRDAWNRDCFVVNEENRQAREAHKDRVEDVADRLSSVREEIAHNNLAIEEKRQAIAQLEKDINKIAKGTHDLRELEAAFLGEQGYLPTEPAQNPLPDETITQQQIDDEAAKVITIEEQNTAIRAMNEKRGVTAKLNTAQEIAANVQESVNKVLTEKRTRILNAKMPIEGLGIDEENVLLNDIPLQRLSTGQQIRISTAIAMGLNPKLRVILVRQGSLLDSAGKKILQDMAAAQGFQLWEEEVTDAPGAGIYIEDGQVKG